MKLNQLLIIIIIKIIKILAVHQMALLIHFFGTLVFSISERLYSQNYA